MEANLLCPEDKCLTEHCEHIKALLRVLEQGNLELCGDLQMCLIKCHDCNDSHGF